ncbi:hypothetical protein [Gemmobacter caeruleus]|nr:hypothetical protein [Gemmobacter caeruleus]
MIAKDTAPWRAPPLEPTLTEMLRQALNGLIPPTPDFMALFDRMETPR